MITAFTKISPMFITFVIPQSTSAKDKYPLPFGSNELKSCLRLFFVSGSCWKGSFWDTIFQSTSIFFSLTLDGFVFVFFFFFSPSLIKPLPSPPSSASSSSSKSSFCLIAQSANSSNNTIPAPSASICLNTFVGSSIFNPHLATSSTE